MCDSPHWLQWHSKDLPRRWWKVCLCGHYSPPPLLSSSLPPSALPISTSPLRALVSSGVGWACAVAVSPGTLSSLSAALHLHNHICVPLVCQVNLLMSGPPINNTLLDSFYFLVGVGVGWRIFSCKLFLRKVEEEMACGDLMSFIWAKCSFEVLRIKIWHPSWKNYNAHWYLIQKSLPLYIYIYFYIKSHILSNIEKLNNSLLRNSAFLISGF